MRYLNRAAFILVDMVLLPLFRDWAQRGICSPRDYHEALAVHEALRSKVEAKS